MDLSGFGPDERKVLRKLDRPARIQDYLNALPMNFETAGHTCMSPCSVMRAGTAHCMEGAMFAAAALRLHGHRPLVVDLEATPDDDDHVVAVFKTDGCWGAIGKTNHAVLRYREPVYRNVRELVMSFFHEYFLNHNGKKTLRRYTSPVDLSRFDARGWMTSEEDVWFVPEHLVEVKHHDLLSASQIRSLRKAESIEIDAGSIVGEKDPVDRQPGTAPQRPRG